MKYVNFSERKVEKCVIEVTFMMNIQKFFSVLFLCEVTELDDTMKKIYLRKKRIR